MERSIFERQLQHPQLPNSCLEGRDQPWDDAEDLGLTQKHQVSALLGLAGA